ncbi:ATP-binding protein [Trichlorobacter lovleyi]|uniref:ATP-binding response regulator n=1 Tax=Trichlorobacter lovleyi TaxID=313985 RepID=UPI002240DFF8|nr:ATP-binding protein [Trichlorobacter lovleyi]
MESYSPPILVVVSDDLVRTELAAWIQSGYAGAVYSEPTGQAALHSLTHLYDVGIVAAEESALMPNGSHVLSAIQQIYPDFRRVLLLYDGSKHEQALALLNGREIHDVVFEPKSRADVLKMLDRQAPIRRELENRRIEIINAASQLNMVALSPSQLNMMLDMHLKNSTSPGVPRNIQKLTRHIRTLWDTERRRLAADIHDELGQRLTAIQLGISSLMYQPIPTDCIKELYLVQEQISEMHKSVRNILNGLRSESLETLGLIPALRQLATNVAKLSQIKCNFICNVDEISIKDQDVLDSIYRIVQESLTNAIKHSCAENVKVELSCPLDGHYMQVTVADDGVGANLENIDFTPGYGILGMRERAESFGGKFDITSTQGYGTTVILICPLSI